MKTIYKYRLNIVDEQVLKLPAGFIPVSVLCVDNELYLYAQVDTEEKNIEYYQVIIIGTGNPIKHHLQQHRFFFSHTMIRGGFVFVWHVFGKRLV